MKEKKKSENFESEDKVLHLTDIETYWFALF